MKDHHLDQFCGSKFWDSNVTWNTDSPDLTDCFQRTVLIWTPCLFLWTFSFLEIYYIRNSRKRDIPNTWIFHSKFLLTLLLIVITFVDLMKAAFTSTTVHSVDYVTPCVQIVSFTVALLFLIYNKKYGLRTSGLLFLFWISLALCGTVQFRSILLNNKDKASYKVISYLIYYAVVIVIFLLNFLVDAEPTFSEYPRLVKPCPEQSALFPSRILFSWFGSLVWKGFKKPLETTDLWSLNPEESAKEVVPRFEKYWMKCLQKSDNTQVAKATFGKSSGRLDFNMERKKNKASVLLPLCEAFGPTFLFGALLMLVSEIMTFINPHILNLLIRFVSNGEPMWKGYLYAISFLIVAVFHTLVWSQYTNRMFLVGLRIRTALIAAIYKKALRLSNSARKESSVGEIVNLMSVDAQTLMVIMDHINMIWSAPLVIALALYFLWGLLGPSVLPGLAVLIILTPTNAWIARKIQNLQIEQMKNKDERVKLTNEVLGGIKVLKLYAWEPSFEQQILEIRNKEIEGLKRGAYLKAGADFIWTCVPVLISVASFVTYLLIDSNNKLDSATAFVSLTYLNLIQFPMGMFPLVISLVVQASVSLKRINKFMNLEELDSDNVQHDTSEDYPIVIDNATFTWDKKNMEQPTLQNINFIVEPGQFVAVVGTVGSGKSSLISAVLGEMERLSGRVNTKGSIAYVSQQAWIQHATLQDNVLFGKAFDKTLYNHVIEACALEADLEILPAGDETEIGEKGINLSGGQKQRVSLARAVYSDSDIYLLDDPLSAVDSHVGKHIFDNLIGPQGMIKGKTRILITHGITYLPEVDNIIVMKDGEISEIGTYNELLEKKGAFAEFFIQRPQDAVKNDKSEDDSNEIKRRLELSVGDREEKLRESMSRMSNVVSDSGSDKKALSGSLHSMQNSVDSQRSNSVQDKKIEEKTGKKLIDVEKTETGRVKWEVYSHYLRSFGWFLVLSVIVLIAGSQMFKMGSGVWLAEWTNANTARVNGTWTRDMFLGVYCAFAIGQGVMISCMSFLFANGTVIASRGLFETMIKRVLRSSMSFFESTPVGRIHNRLGQDINVVDNILPLNLQEWMICFIEAIAKLVLISYSTPIFLTVIIPIGIIYCLIQRFYVATSRQLIRLESVSRSPIYSHFGESLTGAQTIRAYEVEQRFIHESESKVDCNQLCYYPSFIASRWSTVRMQMIGNMILFFSALFMVLNKESINGGIVGLSITSALQITGFLNYLITLTTNVGTNIVAVERVKEYGETPQEASWGIAETEPPKDWPLVGRVEFQDYKVRYREGLDLVLNGLSFVVQGSGKVGIVGRTGAGKSSLTLSLFRIIEAAHGQIFIDGIDISKIGLHDLRSRLTIIPQDPVLFSGSLRFNLDPFNRYKDEDIWRVLAHAHLKTFVQSLPHGIWNEVSEGGENLSVGQRQLICLARALLRKTKILVLDEATAAVDLETDDLIQRTIREEFKDCTVLTIAHRLNTIMDLDKVIVLDKGYVVEFESPETLLQETDSIFYGMAKDAGLTLS